MPIYSNEGGVLYKLDTVPDNEGGVLYEQDTVHSNEDGVLYEMLGKRYPEALTWVYANAMSKTPTVSNNGLSVSNTNRPNSTIAYSSVQSNEFDIRGIVTVELSFSRSSYYTVNSGGVQIRTPDGTSVYSSSTDKSEFTDTVTLTSGTYYIYTGSSGGDQSGTGANQFDLEISFS